MFYLCSTWKIPSFLSPRLVKRKKNCFVQDSRPTQKFGPDPKVVKTFNIKMGRGE